MRELPSGGQFGIQGNIVNVPADNLSTVKMLPRQLPQSQTIPVKLKRRLRYKSHVMFENVRPQKCVEATKYLLTKPLFQQHVPDGLDKKWLSSHVEEIKNTEWANFLAKTEVDRKLEKDMANHDIVDDEDDWSEDDDVNDNDKQQEPDGVYDTMLYPENIDQQREILSFAPSEGNIPVSSLGSAIEELSFPAIFCGEKRPDNKEREKPVKYSEICKSELRQSDRRAAQNITNIFFKAKKIQIKQIQDKIWLSLRRVKTKGKSITAKDLKDQSTVDNLVKLDDGFRIFRTLRGSPPYWEAAKRDLFAMVRQLGLPTFFISLTAAETRWKPLLTSLGQIIDKKTYSEDEIDNMTWQNRCRLIRSDPVTTARYFDYRVQKFFHSFLRSPLEPLGKVKDFFYRIEFQQRGSPHVHSVLWIENAPILDVSKNEEIEDFISHYITTDRKKPTDDTQPDLVKVQCHRHSHTCRKKTSKTCRFNYPLPPMRKTTILDPLPADLKAAEMQACKARYEVIHTELSKQTAIDCTFDEFLKRLNISEDQYISAIQSSLKDAKIFLKRDPECIRVNGYNETVLQAWMANMDIQFITNAYACLMYIVNYVSKGQRGMSNLLRRACDEARKGNSDIREQVRAVGNKFLKHVEISAQEAVYIVLQMKLKNSSCGHIFINTSPPDERPFIVKPTEELEQLSGDSTDVQCSNVIKRYSKRPKKVENLCLADFAAWYDMRIEKKIDKNKTDTADLKETDDEDNLDDCAYDSDEHESEDHPQTLLYKNGIVLRRRKKKKVIRYVRYSKVKDPENYYRESLLLFMPWRKEETLASPFESYAEKNDHVKEEIIEKKKEYEHHVEEIEAAEKQIENEMEDDLFDGIAPGTQHVERQDQENIQREDLDDIGENLFTEYDIGKEIQCAGTDHMEETLRNRLSDTEFRTLARSLNKKQMEFFLHVLKKCKTSDEQFMFFLSGGAGVGKTRLTKCLHQALLRFYNTAEGENPEQKTVLLSAPTGKAAYLIKGVTLHTGFHIPVNQGFQYHPLKNDTLNTMRHQMEKIKLIIIDEISMCGSRLFSFINQRMQEIMNVSKPFGGVSILTIGDLFQLKPVMDCWIFQQPSGNSTEILSENIWKNHFLLFELTEIMRQKDDLVFAQILNRIREGNQSAADVQFLNSRKITSQNPAYPVYATHLLYHNSSVDAYNENLLTRSETQKVKLTCTDIVIGDVSVEVKEEIKAKAKDVEMGLFKVCPIAVGLRTELTVNIDLNDGLVNGAGGVVKKIDFIINKVELIWLKFDDDDVGKSLRAEYRKIKQTKISKDWTPIEFTVGKYKSIKISRKQFPLRIAAAKTLHRSQGDTLKQAVIELPSRKECHMHYVAFSRAEKAENMFILGDVHADKIKVSPDVKVEMERLRNERKLTLCFKPLYNIEKSHFKICFHNSQSLHLHISDVQADYNFSEADVNFFVESRLCAEDNSDDYQLTGFQLYRNDFKLQRNSYGTVAYIRNKLDAEKQRLNYENIELTLLRFQHIQLICVYSRPKESVSSLLKAMKHLLQIKIDKNIPVIIAGDFNCDISRNNSDGTKLVQVMESFGLRQLVNEYTTDGRTIIDLVFSNFHGATECGVLESYFSYHKPVWIAIDLLL